MPSNNNDNAGKAKKVKKTSRSGDPRKRAEAEAEPTPESSEAAPRPGSSKYAPSTWGSNPAGGVPVELEVPSGQLCLVRRPGVQGLMAAGVLHEMDSITQIIDEKHLQRVHGKGGKGVANAEKAAEEILANPSAMENIIHTMDRVVCHTVLQPEVHMTPNDVTRRKDGLVYADMIDLEDKLFIFQFVTGGTKDVESFRNELDESMGGLGSVQDLEDAPE